jgi:hypothetical protein
MNSKGYVAIFSAPLNKESISLFVESWLERFERVEQVTPEPGLSATALAIKNREEIMWEPGLQFRVVNGDEFCWVYVTLNRQVIETTGVPSDEISLCLDVLLELEGITEIVEEHNDKRLDELEKQGLL